MIQGHLSTSMDRRAHDTLLNSDYLNGLVEEKKKAFYLMVFPLSSLTTNDWGTYRKTGKIPSTYDPTQDFIHIW